MEIFSHLSVDKRNGPLCNISLPHNVLVMASKILLGVVIFIAAGCTKEPSSVPDTLAMQEITKAGLIEKEHFDILTKGVLHEGDGITVAEYFWYGCNHCFDMEPIVREWKAAMPQNSKILRIPVVWRNDMILHGKAYYAGESLVRDGKLSSSNWEALHYSMFLTIMGFTAQTSPDEQRKTLQKHFERFGVSKDDFDRALDSEETDSKLTIARSWQKKSKIDGTPTFIVDGVYRINKDNLAMKEDLIVRGNRLIRAIKKAKRQHKSERTEA